MTKLSFAQPLAHVNRRVWLVTVALLSCLLIFTWQQVHGAQSYSFAVPELRMQVYVNPDASARIVYDITFANSAAGSAIDIVDIGVPHEDYRLNTFRASINGQPLSDIRVSEFVAPGVEIHLDGQAIAPGREATLQVQFSMPDMVYQDTTDEELASLQVTPTWFDDQFVRGVGTVWVLIHMLPEVSPEEVVYQDVPFSDKVIFEEHVVGVWRWEDVRITQPYLVGVSFPQNGMNRVVSQNLLELAVEWLEDNPTTRLLLGGLTLALLALAFFRFSGGTGLTVFALLSCGLIYVLAMNAAWQLFMLPGMAAVAGLNEWYLSQRKPRYLPAIAQVEGGGIKRGLTAPEAAVLLELPLNKVLTLILFGLLEKRVVTATSHDPLQLKVSPEFQVAKGSAVQRRKQRVQIAQRQGVVLRTYEHGFIDVLTVNGDRPVHELDFSEPVKHLLEHTAQRLKGFDLSDTQDYYRKIVARALQEAQRIGEIPERERYIDRHLQWLLMGDSYRDVFTHRGYHYRPIWVRPFASADRLGGTGLSGRPAAGSSAPGTTSFASVAASFAGWTENTMGQLADAIAPAGLELPSASGAINLSGVDRVTGDIFKELAKSAASGGSSSGGGSCACACAGCACACACAGGGR